mgnify:CR=1 FL=1
MTDRILAMLALLALVAFVIVVPIFVPEIDLIILAIVTIGLATFDFWRELFRGNGKGK